MSVGNIWFVLAWLCLFRLSVIVAGWSVDADFILVQSMFSSEPVIVNILGIFFDIFLNQTGIEYRYDTVSIQTDNDALWITAEGGMF